MGRKLNAILPNVIVPLAGLSTDIYLPSMPSIVHIFNTDMAQMQLSLTLFVVAMGFMLEHRLTNTLFNT